MILWKSVASAVLCTVMQETRCESISRKCVGIKSVTHCRDAKCMDARAVVVVWLSIFLSLDVLARNLPLKDTDINCLRTFSDNESRRSTQQNFTQQCQRVCSRSLSEDQTALHKAIRADVFKWDLKHDFYDKIP